jgi:hypothetical protein
MIHDEKVTKTERSYSFMTILERLLISLEFHKSKINQFAENEAHEFKMRN